MWRRPRPHENLRTTCFSRAQGELKLHFPVVCLHPHSLFPSDLHLSFFLATINVFLSIGWSDSTAQKVSALQVAYLGSILRIHSVP